MSAEPTSPTPVPEIKPAVVFTEKEENVLKVAWSCLKAGPPEVDIAKLTKAGGFNTAKTAANTWGVIKKKLALLSPQVATGEDTVEGATATPKTPKTKATPKKRNKKTGSDGDEEGPTADGNESPPKKQRKTPVKKTPVKVKDEEATAIKQEAAEEATEEDAEGEIVV